MKRSHKICYITGASLLCAVSLTWCLHSLSNVHGDTYDETTDIITEVVENTTAPGQTSELSTAPATTKATETTFAEMTTTTNETTEIATKKIAKNKIKAITLKNKKLRLVVGKKKKIKASITYKKKQGAKEAVVFKSSNPGVATVSSKGIIKAYSTGKAKIYCKSASGKITASCKVIVIKPYNKIKLVGLNERKIRVNTGDKRYLKATALYKTSKKPDNEPFIWKSLDKSVCTVSKKGVVTGKKDGTTYVKLQAKYSKTSVQCKVTVGKTKYIAITFDDGPGPYTNQLLDTLDKYDFKATFLLVGSSVKKYAAQVKREYALGMQIGNHTWSHANLSASSASQIRYQINSAKKAIKKVLGVNPTIFRPPYGNYNKTVAASVDVPMIFWSVDTLDWKNRNTEYVKRTVFKNASDGAVVLLHDIHPTSVNGLIKALPKLKKQNYELVTVDELFKIKGKKMKKGVMYISAK